MPNAQILIVGAGPTGLVLALSLTKQGIPVRIIDKNIEPGQSSRALIVHARTLEFYAQFGIANTVISQGIEPNTIHLREQGREAAAFHLKDMGRGLSPFPFALCFPQDDHERLLIAELKKLGVEVERGVELRTFTQGSSSVSAVLVDRQNATQHADFTYLCGCDGARSKVRETLNVGFSGGTYDRKFYVADVSYSGDLPPDLYMNLQPASFLLMVPVRSSGMRRLVGIIPQELVDKPDLSFEDVRASAEQALGLPVEKVNWFSSYHVHHRVAAQFRVGRCFLLGDAAHIHSPVGGQGMNTGIGDAVNLGWKLATVLEKRAQTHLLDTFEPERIAFARTLVATTDRAFQGIVNPGLGGRLLRTWILPNLAALVSHSGAVRRAMFRAVSQIQIEYRHSALSQGKADRVQGGDRLPWVETEGTGNFKPLESLSWQLHVYGAAALALAQKLAELNLQLCAFDWSHAAAKSGIQKDAAYLIRPDGYIALVLPEQSVDTLLSFIQKFDLKFVASELS